MPEGRFDTMIGTWAVRGIVLVGLLAVVALPGPRATAQDAAGRPEGNGLGQVWVSQSECSLGHPPAGVTMAAWSAVCQKPVTGNTVRLIRGEEELAQQTRIDVALPVQGIAVWSDLPPGPLAIGGEQPAGYRGVAIFCHVAGDPAGPRRVQNLEFDLGAGEVLSCFFFYLPEAFGPTADATGSITVVVRICQEFMTPQEYAPLFCFLSDPPVAPPFVRAASTGDELPMVSGSGGPLTFRLGDLPYGDYQVGLDQPAVYLIAGIEGVSGDDGFPPSITVDETTPHLAVAIYVFPHLTAAGA